MEESYFFTILRIALMGIGVLFALLILILTAYQWFSWIKCKGRFQNITAPTNRIRYLLADLFVKIINDFRHLLALFIVSIFAISLFYGFIISGTDIEKFTTAIQSTVAALGGLVGSIIGYYFGESAGRREVQKDVRADEGVEENEQIIADIDTEDDETIVQAPDISDRVE